MILSLKPRPSHSSSLCLHLDLFTFCSMCMPALTYIVACTDFLRSRFSSCPRARFDPVRPRKFCSRNSSPLSYIFFRVSALSKFINQKVARCSVDQWNYPCHLARRVCLTSWSVLYSRVLLMGFINSCPPGSEVNRWYFRSTITSADVSSGILENQIMTLKLSLQVGDWIWIWIVKRC